ncbi:MAG: AsnC family transcriptional regulator [Sulfurimicrobium sp.]|nr:AsnC family transcriptional regulator [Sulfurimicrobium sp.]MDP1703841.1 AsnC family transcriptional regulator [Sulfurimicrobium sp.]MDP2961472.1 AsnC family transcriptional regulator [Sulfurimicrobium sp.]MDP3687506.1 AsnC family transcriptional regulator [Sulfurimicrobium sp.]MDZ7656493.1 AsnC family transcriptional regulator [Sulfurimicrobium sp.]
MIELDALDRAIINRLQDGFPICEHPYAAVAEELGMCEKDLLERLEYLLYDRVLTRFGPMYHAERLGGGLSLAALKIPPEDFERVAGIVNLMPEVAHNYARDHALNMWFVLATETPEGQQKAIAEIERDTGYPVFNMPKTREYFVGLKFRV